MPNRDAGRSIDDYLDEQEAESFPASDPHSDWSGPPIRVRPEPPDGPDPPRRSSGRTSRSARNALGLGMSIGVVMVAVGLYLFASRYGRRREGFR